MEVVRETYGEVANELIKKGYEIKTVVAEGNVVTGINIDKEQITIEPNGEAVITITPEGSTDGNNYYVRIDGLYYKMNLKNGRIEVEKTASNLEEKPETESLKVTVDKAELINTPEVNEWQVKVTAKENTGTVVLTIKYGEYEKKCTIQIKTKPTASSPSDASVSFSTAYGKVDVIWLKDDSNTVSDVPNAPDLFSNTENPLTPVTWSENEGGTGWEEDETAKAQWYNYRSNNTWKNYTMAEGTVNNTGDNLTSQWANAKNSDGSYFVWIPRYAYRITYYAKDPTVEANANQEEAGYYDGLGMWKAEDGKVKYKIDTGAKTIEHEGESYIVHPAFINDTANNYELGGWDKNLKGIWVAKYEMSGETNGTASDPRDVLTNTTIKAVSKPNVASWRYIQIGKCYSNSYNYERGKESHLMKNSEWGACAYLTQSKYGRNGHEIDINNSSTYITGNGGGSPTASAGTGSAYNTKSRSQSKYHRKYIWNI